MPSRDVRDVVFRFLGETKDLKRATGQAEKGVGGIGGAMKKVAGLAAGAFAVERVVDFAQQSISAASAYTESVNAVEVATGEASDAILKLGDSSAEAFGLSKTELNEAAVSLDGFLEKLDAPQEDTFEDIIGRATDFASVMNLDVNDALGKFQSALAGESEPLRKFGLDMSAASVSAHAVAEGLHATGKNMTEAEKVAARYSLLMKQTADFQGDFANTSEDAANRSRILQARVKDLHIEVGQELLPVYNDLLGTALDLTPALAGVTGAVVSQLRPVADLTSGISTLADSETTALEKGEGLRGVMVGVAKVMTAAQLAIAPAVWAIDHFRDTTDKTIDSMQEFGDTQLIIADALRKETATGFSVAASAAQDLADVDLDVAASRVERFTNRTTAALNDVVGSYKRAEEAARRFGSLDYVSFGVGDDRGREDEYYNNNNGYPYDAR
jgi:hypothetical protein